MIIYKCPFLLQSSSDYCVDVGCLRERTWDLAGVLIGSKSGDRIVGNDILNQFNCLL